MIILNNPLDLLKTYLMLNRCFYKYLIYFFMIGLGVALVFLTGKNFIALFNKAWPDIPFGIAIATETFKIFFSSFFISLGMVLKPAFVLMTVSTFLYLTLKFILNLKEIIEKIKASDFTKTFSNKENLKSIISSLWILQLANLCYLVLGPLVNLEHLTKGEKSWTYFHYIVSTLDFITIDLSGVTPLIVLLVVELLHNLTTKNHALEDELGTIV